MSDKMMYTAPRTDEERFGSTPEVTVVEKQKTIGTMAKDVAIYGGSSALLATALVDVVVFSNTDFESIERSLVSIFTVALNISLVVGKKLLDRV